MSIRYACAALLTVLLWQASPAVAQQWAERMFENTQHSFGTVARGAKVEYSFPFTNIYKEEVHVSSVRSSCGCTSPEVTIDTLKSREKSEIRAVLNTRAFLGEKDAVITVAFDKPYAAEVQIKVDAYIRSDVVLTPGNLSFGTVQQGAAADKPIEIDYAGREDWKITDVRTTNPHLEATLDEIKRGDGRVSYKMVLRLTKDAPPGYIKEQLTVVTNDAKYTTFPIDVEGKVESGVSVSPSPLFLGVLRPGQKVTKRVVVRGQKPFKILGIECKDDCFQFEADDESKTLHLVPITFVAPSGGGKFTGRIHIETDLGKNVVPDLMASVQVVE